ncbi:MAG TPA: DUF72 domain-containing protein [Herpetosiphonaceae bacterium]
MSNIYLGCAVWGHRPWVGGFLPTGIRPAEMLRAYGQRLTTVEVNSTFYALPDQATVERWAEDTPPGFRFCPKVSRDVSHGGKLAGTEAATELFAGRIRSFGDRLGPAFIQMPPTYGPDMLDDLAGWLERWPADLRLAVEVRHREWFTAAGAAALDTLLNERRHGRVVVDVRPINTGATSDPIIVAARVKKPNVPLHTAVTAPWSLVRFMGHPEAAINAPLIEEWAGRLKTWSELSVESYVFMHCPVEDLSPEWCRMLADRLIEAGAPAPIPDPPAPLRQASMFDL